MYHTTHISTAHIHSSIYEIFHIEFHISYIIQLSLKAFTIKIFSGFGNFLFLLDDPFLGFNKLLFTLLLEFILVQWNLDLTNLNLTKSSV